MKHRKNPFRPAIPPDGSGNDQATACKRSGEMVVRTSAAERHGRVQDGGGCVRLSRGALEASYSFASRLEATAGSNPQEIIVAATQSCFPMAIPLHLTVTS